MVIGRLLIKLEFIEEMLISILFTNYININNQNKIGSSLK